MTTTDRLLMTGNLQVDLISSFIFAYDISSLNSNIFENSTVTKAGKMPSIPLYTSFHALGLEICTWNRVCQYDKCKSESKYIKNAARKPNYRKFWTWMVELSANTGGQRNSITLGSTNFTMQWHPRNWNTIAKIPGSVPLTEQTCELIEVGSVVHELLSSKVDRCSLDESRNFLHSESDWH